MSETTATVTASQDISEKTASALNDLAKKAASAISKTEVHEIPGTPETLPETIYRLRFKVGQSPVQDMNFKFEKDQRKAETAAREFCARWKYRFIWVEEFLVDILSSPIIFEDGSAQKRPQLSIK